jgi:hypothetical protein
MPKGKTRTLQLILNARTLEYEQAAAAGVRALDHYARQYQRKQLIRVLESRMAQQVGLSPDAPRWMLGYWVDLYRWSQAVIEAFSVFPTAEQAFRRLGAIGQAGFRARIDPDTRHGRHSHISRHQYQLKYGRGKVRK